MSNKATQSKRSRGRAGGDLNADLSAAVDGKPKAAKKSKATKTATESKK